MRTYIKKPLVIIPLIIIVLGAGYFIFFSRPASLNKAIISMKVSNYDGAVSTLKNYLGENPDNSEAKALLIYAESRKYYYDRELEKYTDASGQLAKIARKIKLVNAITVMQKNSLLTSGYKKIGTSNWRELKAELKKIHINVEDEESFIKTVKSMVKTGASELKKGDDEITNAYLDFCLSIDCYFGSTKSGTELIQNIKTQNGAEEFLTVCGEELNDAIPQILDPENPLNGFAVESLINNQIAGKIEELSNSYPNMRLFNADSMKKDLGYYYNRFSNNTVLLTNKIVSLMVEAKSKNKVIEFNVSRDLGKENRIICINFYSETAQCFINAFYQFVDNQLKPINFDLSSSNLIRSLNAPLLLKRYDAANNRFEFEEFVSEQKVRSTFEYVNGNFRESRNIYTEMSSKSKIYQLNGDNASQINNNMPW